MSAVRLRPTDVARISTLVGALLAVVLLGCGSGARVAALRTSYPYVPGAVVQFVPVGRHTLRVITAGSGPPLLLLHTLRAQADYFGALAPRLTDDWTVTIMDLPGHGFSDAPEVDYDQAFFTATIRELMQVRGLRDVVIVGESIGASIALALAVEDACRVRSVVALNPYDYVAGGAGGIARASPVAHVYFHALEWPVVGWIASHIEPRFALQKILQAGFSDADKLPDRYLNVLSDVGIEAHAIRSVEREHASWARARAAYARIRVPVHLVYGSADWSRTAERDANARAISTARLTILPASGHFSSLESPALVADLIRQEQGSAPRTEPCP
jgi:pimeloyl-ACP methyl ester carboxylesterase